MHAIATLVAAGRNRSPLLEVERCFTATEPCFGRDRPGSPKARPSQTELLKPFGRSAADQK